MSRSTSMLRGLPFRLLAGVFAFALALFAFLDAPSAHVGAIQSQSSDFASMDREELAFFEAFACDGLEPADLQKTAATQPAKGKLPTRVDNSLSKYFPPIIDQKGESCGQASGIHYTFTYEMNLARNLDSRLPQNQYPDHWTWNCLNGAKNLGTRANQGWSIIKEVGIPTLPTYGDRFSMHNDAGWPSGYEKYYAAMKNRVDSFGSMPATTPAGLEKIKGYLFNHNDPEQKFGGLMNFRILNGGRKTVRIPAGQYEAGRPLITAWGTTNGHGMTYIGYDDNVGFDLNGDGKITNDIDINGDGKVDLSDWERGAYIWVDSHGLKSGDGGKGYVLYSLAAHPEEKGRGDTAQWVKVKKDYQPTTTLMLKFKFSDRSALRLTVGFADGPDATKSSIKSQPGIFNGKHDVGAVPMRGIGNTQPIEIGLDISGIVSGNGAGKYFVSLDRKNDSTAKGELQAAAIYRYDEKGKRISADNFAVKNATFGDERLELSVAVK